MEINIINELKIIIANSIGENITPDSLSNDYQLVGNILDSMAVTNLILGIEEYFDFTFDDEDLSAESFETVQTVAKLVEEKIKSCGG